MIVAQKDLFVLTLCSALTAIAIFALALVDTGLWMNISTSIVTIIYHITVVSISTNPKGVYVIHTSIASAGCASLLVIAWLATFIITVLLATIANRPLGVSARVDIIHCGLAGAEMGMMCGIAVLSLRWANSPRRLGYTARGIHPVSLSQP